MSHDSFHDGDPPVISSKIMNASRRFEARSVDSSRADSSRATLSRESRRRGERGGTRSKSNALRFRLPRRLRPKSEAGDPLGEPHALQSALHINRRTCNRGTKCRNVRACVRACVSLKVKVRGDTFAATLRARIYPLICAVIALLRYLRPADSKTIVELVARYGSGEREREREREGEEGEDEGDDAHKASTYLVLAETPIISFNKEFNATARRLLGWDGAKRDRRLIYFFSRLSCARRTAF